MIPSSSIQKFESSLMRALMYAKSRDYAGYSKFDAMNSPLLEKVAGWHPMLRLIAIQAINRTPLDIRKAVGVRKSRNPKGIANFIKAWSLLYRIKPQSTIKKEIESLTDWLKSKNANQNGEFSGSCWGYNFAWQNPGFYTPRFFPNAIVSVFCAEAFLSAYHALKKHAYLDTAIDAAAYFLNDLPVLEKSDDKKCVGYVTGPLQLKVININAVIGGFLAKLASATGDRRFLREARMMINWTVSVKTDYHAWYYTQPATVYVKHHDNYHTGGILDGISDYLSISEDNRHALTYLKGLKFYDEALFEDSGAPKWRNTKRYPYDIHGSAQGVLTFSKASCLNPSYLDTATRMANWAIDHMQSPAGWFYYQKHRLFIKKLNLMRWNTSWMAWALAELIFKLKNKE